MADLFPDSLPAAPSDEPRADAPLADRLRPRSLADVVGQEHLTGSEGAIGRMVAAGRLSSMILWGPPGTGKTSIARLLADAVGMRFAAISAVFSGVADLKKAFAEADKAAQAGQRTLLFVDEIHRFNRAQQDGFLPFVERGTVTLVGATTENPSFELNAALLSRAQVLILRRLDAAALGQLLDKAEALEGPLPLTDEARADPVLSHLPERFAIMQWHSDTFTLPEGTTHLAHSPKAAAQCFRYGRAGYAMQFHFEANRAVAADWAREFGEAFEVNRPGWVGDFATHAARDGAAADAHGLAIARAWVGLI